MLPHQRRGNRPRISPRPRLLTPTTTPPHHPCVPPSAAAPARPRDALPPLAPTQSLAGVLCLGSGYLTGDVGIQGIRTRPYAGRRLARPGSVSPAPPNRPWGSRPAPRRPARARPGPRAGHGFRSPGRRRVLLPHSSSMASESGWPGQPVSLVAHCPAVHSVRRRTAPRERPRLVFTRAHRGSRAPDAGCCTLPAGRQLAGDVAGCEERSAPGSTGYTKHGRSTASVLFWLILPCTRHRVPRPLRSSARTHTHTHTDSMSTRPGRTHAYENERFPALPWPRKDPRVSARHA